MKSFVYIVYSFINSVAIMSFKQKYKDIMAEVGKEKEDSVSYTRDSKVLIVDGMNLFIRTFSAIPTMNGDGIHVGGLVGFFRSLASTIKMINPTRAIVVFDGKGGSTRRRALFPDYKNNRAMKSRLNRAVGFDDLVDEQNALKYQLLRTYHYLQELPITTIIIDNVEADDVIAYLANYFDESVTILSNDKDFLQLVSNTVSVYSPIKKKLYTPSTLLQEYNIHASNFVIFKALLGDNSDGIPGIRGFGEKTIMKQFPELSNTESVEFDSILEKIKDYDGKTKAMVALQENISQLELNYKLVQLIDVDISGTAKSMIRAIVEGDIPQLNKVGLLRMIQEDKVHNVFTRAEWWLGHNFSQLEAFRNKKG